MKLFLLGLALIATPVSAEVNLLVNLSEQQVYVYDGAELIDSAPVSTGKVGHETPTGTFKVIFKDKNYYSRKYKAPMPYAQMITDYGIALHAGSLPGYPASHGCIRMPYSFAKKLFTLTKSGTAVVIEE